MPNPNDEGALRRARALAREGRWDAAARLYEEQAVKADRRADAATSLQLWTLAGDALRRDDRPAAAARALRRALDRLDGEGAEGAQRRVVVTCELAGVLLEAGELEASEDLVAEAAAGAASPGALALALDTLVGARLARGRVEQAAEALAALERARVPGTAIAVVFRRAALLRLGGQLDQAEGLYANAVAATHDREGLAGPCAAARHELGELALVRGEGEAAATAFDAAARAWTAAGRRAGLYRAEAGLVRAALVRGELPLATSLDGPVRFAGERQMPLLEAELRLARGSARARCHVQGAEQDLDVAVALAESCGARMLEGRARAIRRRCGFLRDDLPRTRQCLEHDKVWLAWLRDRAPGRDLF